MVKDYNCLTILMLNELDKSEDVRDPKMDNSILLIENNIVLCVTSIYYQANLCTSSFCICMSVFVSVSACAFGYVPVSVCIYLCFCILILSLTLSLSFFLFRFFSYDRFDDFFEIVIFRTTER